MVLYCVHDLSTLTAYWLVHHTITVHSTSTLCAHAADKVLLLNTCHSSSESTDNLNHKSCMHICMIHICMRIVFAKIAFSQFWISFCYFNKYSFYQNMSNRCPHCHNFAKSVLFSWVHLNGLKIFSELSLHTQNWSGSFSWVSKACSDSGCGFTEVESLLSWLDDISLKY